MSFSKDIEARALVACGRCCCICHKFCGTKINLHHIKQHADGGEDTFENCIPLCLDCHEDMGKADPRHSTGKHYSEQELIMHRDKWYAKIENEGKMEPITKEEIEKLFSEDTFVLDCGTAEDTDDELLPDGSSNKIVII